MVTERHYAMNQCHKVPKLRYSPLDKRFKYVELAVNACNEKNVLLAHSVRRELRVAEGHFVSYLFPDAIFDTSFVVVCVAGVPENRKYFDQR